MGSLNVNMPDDLRRYVDARTKAGGFGTPTEYVRHLIRKDREEAVERNLEAQLMRGLESGNARGDVKALFGRLHTRVAELEREKRTKGRNGKSSARSKARGRA